MLPIIIRKPEDFIWSNLAKVSRSVSREKQGFEIGLISGQDIPCIVIGLVYMP